MIELKLSFPSLAELNAFLAQHSAPAAVAEAPPKPKEEKPSTKPKSEASAPAAPAATPAASPPTAATAPTAAPASPAGEPVTYEKSGIAEKISKLVTKDRAAAVALLAEFNVAKGPMLKPDQFEAFGAKIDALLAPAEALS